MNEELEKALDELLYHDGRCRFCHSWASDLHEPDTCTGAAMCSRIRDLFAQTLPRERVREMLIRALDETPWAKEIRADQLLAELDGGQSGNEATD